MGITIEVTNVNKEGSFVSFNQDGQSKTAEVVAPAQIKWARVGKSEARFNTDGKINFIKSLEPKAVNNTSNFGGYPKKEQTHRAISTMEILEDVSLKEIQSVYNELNAQDKKKCGASTLFLKGDGKYDAALYVTTFVPLTIPQPTVNTADMMGIEEHI